ncbi:hypothetical protein THIOSC15_3490004 [uncultured Thiomicrorhabdus sp.]
MNKGILEVTERIIERSKQTREIYRRHCRGQVFARSSRLIRLQQLSARHGSGIQRR